jgi:AraC family transcriptional regulator of arabinose operon
MNRPEKGEGFPGQRMVVLPRGVVTRSLKHPLLRGLMLTDVGFFPQAAGHLRERAKGVDQAVFIYCTRGRGWCELAGVRHVVQAGELLVIPPEAPHAYGADPERPWTITWVHATGDHIGLYLKELGTSIERPVLYLGENPQVLALFEEVLEEVEHGYAPAQLLYASQVLAHLIGVMIRHRHKQRRGSPDREQNIAQTVQFMKQHLEQPLHIAALAAMANLSASHYIALFKRQTGHAPIDYFIRLRMRQACQLLDTTELSVKEIAARVGYEDPFHFSRVFKTVNEASPTDYRLMHKG